MASVQHVSLVTGPNNLGLLRDFYSTILQPLGYKIYYDKSPIGFTGAKGPDFWLHPGDEDIPLLNSEDSTKRRPGTHVAFGVESRKAVDEWYENALKAGGVSNGEPGLRHGDTYYAAFVLDPVGNNIEALHLGPS